MGPTDGYNIDDVSIKLGLSAEKVLLIINKFLSRIDEYSSDLDDAVRSGDYERIARSAHKFKGAAVNLRFDSLAESLKNIELKAKASENLDYAAMTEVVKKEIDMLLKTFEI